MTTHVIRLSHSGERVVIDEDTSLSDIEPAFFRTPHGKRETYNMYRGFLIVRSTVQFDGAPPTRKTVVYLFTKNLEGRPSTLCCGHPANDRAARRYIDNMIAAGAVTEA